ncbi:MFS general substrate transporter [Biscogniauxia marginata]|nr:MFS general substrate transporter [Biscogniauxia marginata]
MDPSPADTSSPPDTLNSGTSLPPKQKSAGRGFRFWALFVCLALTAFLSALEGSIVSTALPTISREINVAENYVWVINVYFLTSAAVQPLYGQLADLWGRRWLMIGAVAIFVLGSGICGGANSPNMLIGGRTVQGLGAAGINVLVELILCDVLPLRERGQFMGLLFVFITLGSVIGPFAGGILVERVSWRWAFYINLPLGGASLILLLLVLRLKHRATDTFAEKVKKIDFVGNFILTASVTSVLYALVYGGTRYQWSHPSMIITLVLGLFGHILFLLFEASRFCPQPVMPIIMFKNRTSAAGFILTFLQTMVSYWALYFLPLYFQAVLLVSPTFSGIYLLPFSILYSVGAAIGGGIATKLGRFKIIHIVGFALMTISMGVFTIFDRYTHQAVYIILQLIIAAGLGIVMACLLPAIQTALPDSLNAASTGTFAFIRSVGTIWGVGIPAAIFNNRFDQLLPSLQDSQAQAALQNGQAYEKASKSFVDSFDPETSNVIVGLYEASIQRVFQLGIIFAGLGFLVSFMEKNLQMRTELETDDFGLADDEKDKGGENREKVAGESN